MASERFPALATIGAVLFIGGCSGSEMPTPTQISDTTVVSVNVAIPAGGTIFIGAQVQFRATATLSDGTTADRTSTATWGSDAPAVATVSSSGIVTAHAPGEATIFADVNPRGTLRIRVYPEFAGTWSGTEVVTLCEESGVFEGLLCDPEVLGVGAVFTHNDRFTQNNESVTAEILFEDSSSTMTGTVSIDGQLELPSAPVLPAVEGIDVQTANWKSRADTPGRMTGTYEWVFTAPGLPGSSRQVYELRDVVRTGATAGPPVPVGVASGESRLDLLRRRLAARRR